MIDKLLSIVVPVYNVQGYLHDCIDSLLAQNIENDSYEIILINDGSKDNSGQIVDDYSKKYENIKGFHFENSGLGAVRNKGIRLAQGKYIAFLDSDDFVPKKAYSSLLESAYYNDAEIVTSPVERFEGGKYTRSGLHKKVDFTQKIGTTLTRTPSLLYDTTSTNKIYNLEFLKENELYFPENIVYEDIYFTMRAYAKAKKIYVIETITYIWRIRTGETLSISQDRFNIQSYKDRTNTCFNTLRFLQNYTNDYISNEFEKRIVIFDLPLFFPDYLHADESYTQEFIHLTRESLKNLDNSLILYCDYRKQVIYEAIKRNDSDLVLNYSLDHARTMKLKDENKIEATDEFLEEDYLKNINFNYSDILKTKVKNVILKNNKLQITTSIKSSILEDIDYKYFSAYITTAKTNEEVHIDHIKDDLYIIMIDLNEISEFYEGNINKVIIKYIKDDLCIEKTLSEPGGLKSNTTLLKKDDQYNYRVNYTFGWELFIEKEEISNIFNNVIISGNKLIIDAMKIDQHSVFKLVNRSEKSIVGHVVNHQIVFDLDEITQHNRLFELLVLNNGLISYNYKFIKMPKYFKYCETNENYEYVLRVYSNHSVSVNRKGKHSKIESLMHVDGKLIVKYSAPYQSKNQKISSKLALKSINGKVTKYFESKKLGNNQYESIIDLQTNDIAHFLTYGTYLLSVDYYIGDKLLPESLLLNEMKNVTFPYEFNYKNRTYQFSSKNGHLIYLKKGQILGKLEDTRKKRSLIYKYLYPLFRFLPKNSKKIVYYSYWGDQVACSPKAIYEKIQKNNKDYKNIWILNDINTPIEGNSVKVKKNSLKYWYHLATAKYFVQNTNMPVWYKKRNGQREIQTFHGTFMKTMGFDTPEFKFETRQHKIDEFQKKVDNWDYISTPSSYMEDKARSAFNIDVKSINAGFPRNDMIFESLTQTNEIKEKLSIPADKKVVLYAPTWRESKSSDINMDIDYMQKTLGDNFILLIRAHYMVSNNMDIRKNYPFAINVSNYPSVEELYAISDVLITDYSSVMFDYAYLKKPMIFYAYDLEKYLYGERGVYLDYENIVPGPVVKTTQEIIDNLKDYNNLEYKYKEKYKLFYNEFCQYGRNGDSASKVIEELIKN